MSDKFDPKSIFRETEEQIRLKIRRFTRDKTVREDIRRVSGSQFEIPPGKHLYLRMSVDYEEAKATSDVLREKVRNSITASQIQIRHLNHKNDIEDFMRLYNEIFAAAPDPSRDLTKEEVFNFPEESTFVALLGSTMTGFIFVSVEPDEADTSQMVGAIAGVGVLARYRGKKIGLKLLDAAFEYLEDKEISRLVCEVYKENEASRKMFEGLGMTVVGYMILEDEFTGEGHDS